MKRLLLAVVLFLGFAAAAAAGHWRYHQGYHYYYDGPRVFYYDAGVYYLWTGYGWEYYAPWSVRAFPSYGYGNFYGRDFYQRDYHRHRHHDHDGDYRGRRSRRSTDEDKTQSKTRWHKSEPHDAAEKSAK